MDDMQAIEQRITRELLRRAGPSELVDDAAIFTAITATQSPKWRFQNMFSAAKYVVAGAIVALFGGFLLAGVLTQPSEPLPPAASSASASPEAVPSVGPTTNDLLPGVDLVTEEVEPGVFRVLRDSVRDLAGVRPKGMSVGQDRSVWLWTETPGLRISQGARGAATLLELGEPGETRFDPPGEFDKGFTAVDADGTFWGAYDPDGDAGRGLASFDGSIWTRHTWPDGADPDFFGIEADDRWRGRGGATCRGRAWPTGRTDGGWRVDHPALGRRCAR